MNAIYLYKLEHWLYHNKVPFLPTLIRNLIFLIFNSYIPPSVEIGKGSTFAYGAIGVVLHAKAKIGSGCVIGQGITIGASEAYFSTIENAAPEIGDNCYISAGARVIGDVKVGSHSIIGAGAIVIKDIPEHSIVVGCPARIVGKTLDSYLAIDKKKTS
jgi:serine O-acetyltransferase